MKIIIYNWLLCIRIRFYAIFYKSKLNNNYTFNNFKWKLSFFDNFSGNELDRSKWRTDAYYGGRYHPGNIINKLQSPLIYMADDAAIVNNDTLKLENRKEITQIEYIDYSTGKNWGEWDIPYVSGQIDSSISFEQKYGYFEIRSKMPNSTGTWPAFWLCSKYAWPPEIDIYEVYTGKKNGMKSFESNVHWGLNNDSHKSKCARHKIMNLTDDFHVYGCEWTEKHIKFYFDGVLVRIFNDINVLNTWFKYPMHIIINNGICDYKGHYLDKATFPNYHEVDYVKAFSRFDFIK
jgi:beta-glucanase (GH16 family)